MELSTLQVDSNLLA